MWIPIYVSSIEAILAKVFNALFKTPECIWFHAVVQIFIVRNPVTAGKFKQRVNFIVYRKELAYQLLCKHPVWQLETREKEKQHTPTHPSIYQPLSWRVYLHMCVVGRMASINEMKLVFYIGHKTPVVWVLIKTLRSSNHLPLFFSPHLQIMGSFQTHCLKMLWKRWISSLSQTSKFVCVLQ